MQRSDAATEKEAIVPTLSQINYHPNPSPSLKATHRNNRIETQCLVYTPPGYDDENGGSYPVLYLLHGVGDVEFSWEVHGRASVILDELLKDNLIQPMVVVMPYGFESSMDKRKRKFSSKSWFDQYLERVIAEVEQAYNIQVGTTTGGRYVRRVVAGLSMGAKQALEFGLDHLTLFSGIGNFSGAIQKRSEEYALPGLLAACKTMQAQIGKLALFYHACGKDDPIGKKGSNNGGGLLDANRQFVAELRAIDIPCLWHELEGDHSWGVWKQCLREFLPIVTSEWRRVEKMQT